MMLEPADHSRSGVEDRRARILAATRQLYASYGSRGTTTREVADRAGVNEATLFRHFGTKTQLLAAMVDRYASHDVFPEIMARVATLTTIDEQLRELAHATIAVMKDREDIIRVSLAEEISNPESMQSAWRAPVEARKIFVEWFDERIRAGDLRGDADWLARVFLSLLFSFVMARRIWADVDLPRERSVANLVEIFLNGVRS
jgi:AcrR family transcriptional regulator